PIVLVFSRDDDRHSLLAVVNLFHKGICARGEHRIGMENLSCLTVSPGAPQSSNGENRLFGEVYEIRILRFSSIEPSPFEKASARDKTSLPIRRRITERGLIEHFLTNGIK